MILNEFNDDVTQLRNQFFQNRYRSAYHRCFDIFAVKDCLFMESNPILLIINDIQLKLGKAYVLERYVGNSMITYFPIYWFAKAIKEIGYIEFIIDHPSMEVRFFHGSCVNGALDEFNCGHQYDLNDPEFDCDLVVEKIKTVASYIHHKTIEITTSYTQRRHKNGERDGFPQETGKGTSP